MTTWTVEQMVLNRRRAARLARRYVRLQPVFKDIPAHYILGDEGLTVYLNPAFVGVRYVCRPNCPAWIREQVQDCQQNADDKDESIARRARCENQAYGHVEAAILRRWGFDGYIQGELPF